MFAILPPAWNPVLLAGLHMGAGGANPLFQRRKTSAQVKPFLGFEMNDMKSRFMQKVAIDTKTGCWIWTACVRKSGYGAFGIGKYVEYAHRASWKMFNGCIPDGMYVCHTCDERRCVNPEHLWIGTAKMNMQDASNKGRIKIPKASYESNGSHQPAKLSDDQVKEIRRPCNSKSDSELAIELGVCRHAIWAARTKRTFRAIPC